MWCHKPIPALLKKQQQQHCSATIVRDIHTLDSVFVSDLKTFVIVVYKTAEYTINYSRNT